MYPILFIMLRTLLALISLVFFASTFAATQGPTGEQLLKRCMIAQKVLTSKKADNDFELHHAMWCIAYLRGFEGAHSTRIPSERFYCLPSDMTTRDLLNVVVEYLQLNPDMKKESSDRVTTYALVKAYPCKHNQQ